MGVLSPELLAIRTEALNRFKTTITEIEVGDDGTAFNEAQTGVISTLGTTPIESIDESVAGQISFSGKFGISDLVGDTVREASLNTATDSKTRDLTVVSTKSGDQIYWFDIKVKARAINSTF